MPRIWNCSLIRIIFTVFVLAGILLFFYSDSTTWSNSLRSIQDPVIRLLDYNEYVKEQQQTSSDFVVRTDELLAHIHTHCAKYGYSESKYSSKRKYMPDAVTIAISKYNILYVSNPKTGSTSFKKFILRLQGDMTPYKEMKHVHSFPWTKFQIFNRVHDVIYPNLTVQEVVTDKMYVVGFVRNPITRLISGFRNKVLRMSGSNYNKRYIYQHAPEGASDIERFKVFVKLVTSGVIPNHHFAPQWEKMRVCSFPYNLLGQTETTRDNIETMMRDTGIKGVEFPGSRTDTGTELYILYILKYKVMIN